MWGILAQTLYICSSCVVRSGSAARRTESSRYCNESERHFCIDCISSEIGSIWTKLGRGTEMGVGKSDPIKFSARSLQRPRRIGRTANSNIFCRSGIPRIVLITSTLLISTKLGTNTRIRVLVNHFVAEIWKFPLGVSHFHAIPKTTLFVDFGSYTDIPRHHRMLFTVVSVCSEKNPCQNGGHCVDVPTEEELQNVGVKNAGQSRQIIVRKYSVSRCICRYGFSGELCQHGKLAFCLPFLNILNDMLICSFTLPVVSMLSVN